MLQSGLGPLRTGSFSYHDAPPLYVVGVANTNACRGEAWKEHSCKERAVVTCRWQVPSKRENGYPVIVSCLCEGCGPSAVRASDFLRHATTQLACKYFITDKYCSCFLRYRICKVSVGYTQPSGHLVYHI